MSASKNKKNQREKPASTTSKQEARKKSSLTTFRARLNRPVDVQFLKPPIWLLAGMTITLPFLAWFVAATNNPSGWLSDELTVVYMTFTWLPVRLWYVSIPLLGAIAYLLIVKRAYAAIVLSFLISLAASIYIYHITVNADENEFTG